MNARIKLAALGLGLAAMAAPALESLAQQKEAPPVRIGYAMSRTGAFAAGAQITQEPSYILWGEQINARGGLNVKGVKRKVELIGYDDRSEVETAVRTVEKLMTADKVDLVLPPWGTTMNFAVMPIANKHGYPMLGPTVSSVKMLQMKMPYFFMMNMTPQEIVKAIGEVLVDRGLKTVGVLYVDEQFGLEMLAEFERSLKGKPVQIVEKKSYPGDVKDLSPALRSIKDKNPDAFVGFTYPPDTFLVTGQSKEIGFNPKMFYASVGTAFPVFPLKMGAAAEGVMGIGMWNAKANPGAKSYYESYVKRFKSEPDRWAAGGTWAGFQILEQAIEKVGLDRRAIRDYIAKNEFQTILGPVRFNGSSSNIPGHVMQWQGKEFEIIWPPKRATAKPIVPKPEFK